MLLNITFTLFSLIIYENAFWHYTSECACADDGKVDSLVGKTVWRSRDASAVY